jgi:hypothetical protein
MATVSLSNKQPVITKRIEEEDYGNVKFIGSKRISVIEEVLPFRIKFTAIQIPSVSPTNVPPIPLQIIGFSNYIL